jgi:Ca2+-binding RTX toxin-like protein
VTEQVEGGTQVGFNGKVAGTKKSDIIAGSQENDSVRCGKGNDQVVAQDGADRIKGDAGNDSLSGGDGYDRLSGGKGNDVIDGGFGADTIDGGAGNDLLFGGEAGEADLFIIGRNAGHDEIADFEPNVDYLDLARKVRIVAMEEIDTDDFSGTRLTLKGGDIIDLTDVTGVTGAGELLL